MFKVHAQHIIGYNGLEVPYTLLSKEEAPKHLAILLPGAGYTVQAPLLHYATGLFLNKSYQVLQVNYQYSSKVYDEFSQEELQEAILHDVDAVIDEVMEGYAYESIYVIGKSIGTTAMGSLLSREAFRDAKAIWLTPLLQRDEVFEAILERPNEGLVVIGDQDQFYTEERFEQLSDLSNLITRLIPDVNHSLEYNDNAVDSIEVLQRVVREMDQF